MHSPVRRYRYILLLGSVALATGCGVGSGGDDHPKCGPTSDFPFCPGSRGLSGEPTLSGGAAGESTGGAGGATTGAMGSGGQDGGATAPPATDGDGDSADCLTCFGGLAGGGGTGGTAADGGVESAEDGGTRECGMPLECDLEMEIDATGVIKSRSGEPPLDFTHASVEWGQQAPEYVVLFLRAVDADGHEVRLRIELDETQLRGEAPVVVEPELTLCGGVDPGALEAVVSGATPSWALGFRGTVTLAGAGWETELLFLGGPVCEVP